MFSSDVGRKMSTYTYNTKPPAAGNAGVMIYLSDTGEGGSTWVSNGSQWNAVNGEYILKTIYVPIVSDGAITESVMDQVLIPAGLLEIGDSIQVDFFGEKSGTVDTQTLRLRFGTTGGITDSTTEVVAQPAATQKNIRRYVRITAVDSTTMRCTSAGGSIGFGTAANALLTATVDRAVDNYFSYTTKMTTGGIETFTMYHIQYKHTTNRV